MLKINNISLVVLIGCITGCQESDSTHTTDSRVTSDYDDQKILAKIMFNAGKYAAKGGVGFSSAETGIQLKEYGYDSVQYVSDRNAQPSIYSSDPYSNSHTATFADNQYENRIGVFFNRENDHTLYSYISLPPRFEITYPEETIVVSPDTDIQITWTNPEPQKKISLEIGSSCDNIYYGDFTYELEDDGEFTFANPIGSLYPTDSKPTCDLFIKLTRSSIGVVDDKLNEESTFTGTRFSLIKTTMRLD